MSKLKVGDKVWWRADFGSARPKVATVAGIEITGGYKYGNPVDEVDWAEVYGRNVTVDIDTDEDEGYWAYGEQIMQWLPYKIK
jgi:hypothetical protein